MFSKTQLVEVRRAIESMYADVCTITEYKEYTKANKSTGHNEVIVIENQPCKLSFSTIAATNQTETTANLVQKTKLFIAPEVIIKAGSKINVTHEGRSVEYEKSGEPAFYGSHQEIILELFRERA